MIGDVNMFLKGEPSHVDDDTEDDFEAEAEIMIAGTCAFSLPPSFTLGPTYTMTLQSLPTEEKA